MTQFLIIKVPIWKLSVNDCQFLLKILASNLKKKLKWD